MQEQVKQILSTAISSLQSQKEALNNSIDEKIRTAKDNAENTTIRDYINSQNQKLNGLVSDINNQANAEVNKLTTKYNQDVNNVRNNANKKIEGLRNDNASSNNAYRTNMYFNIETQMKAGIANDIKEIDSQIANLQKQLEV